MMFLVLLPVHEDSSTVIIGVIGQESVPLVSLLTPAVPGAASSALLSSNMWSRSCEHSSWTLTHTAPGESPAQTRCCWRWLWSCRCCCWPSMEWPAPLMTDTRPLYISHEFNVSYKLINITCHSLTLLVQGSQLVSCLCCWESCWIYHCQMCPAVPPGCPQEHLFWISSLVWRSSPLSAAYSWLMMMVPAVLRTFSWSMLCYHQWTDQSWLEDTDLQTCHTTTEDAVARCCRRENTLTRKYLIKTKSCNIARTLY